MQHLWDNEFLYSRICSIGGLFALAGFPDGTQTGFAPMVPRRDWPLCQTAAQFGSGSGLKSTARGTENVRESLQALTGNAPKNLSGERPMAIRANLALSSVTNDTVKTVFSKQKT